MALIVCPSRRMGAIESPVFANVVCKNATAPVGGISMKAARLSNNGAAAGGVFVDNGVAAGVLRVTAVAAAAASNENSWPASSSFLEKVTGREAPQQWQTSGTVPKNQGASPAKLEKEKTAEHLQPLGGVEEEPPVVSTKELVSLQIPSKLKKTNSRTELAFSCHVGLLNHRRGLPFQALPYRYLHAFELAFLVVVSCCSCARCLVAKYKMFPSA